MKKIIVTVVVVILLACSAAPGTPICKQGPDGKPTPVPCQLSRPRQGGK